MIKVFKHIFLLLMGLIIFACPTPFGYYPDEEDRVADTETGESAPPQSVSSPFILSRDSGSGSYSIAQDGNNFTSDQEIIINSETDDAMFYYTTSTTAFDPVDVSSPSIQLFTSDSDPILVTTSTSDLYLSIIGVKSLMYPSQESQIHITLVETNSNAAPTAVFGITVSGATTYPDINGFYVQDSTFNSRPRYTKSGTTDYYIYYFEPDGEFWGINYALDITYPSYYSNAVHGPVAYIGPLTDTGNTFYPPEAETSRNWKENITGTPQITVTTGITQSGGNLVANYVYSDADGDSEQGSAFRWFQGTNAAGPFNEIAGETSATFSSWSGGTYYIVEVTPADSQGMVGTPVQSDPYYVAPVALP